MDVPRYYDERDLFNRYYQVRFRHIASRSAESIRAYGIRSSGIPSIDSSISNYMVTSELTINQMFEYWRKGVEIRVVNYQDTAEIYEIIQHHLTTTADFIRGSVNASRKELLVDMVDLDKFASVVYDKAKTIFTDRERASVHSHAFAGIQTINFFNILSKDYTRTEEIRVKDGKKEVVTKAATLDNKRAPVRARDDLSKVFIDHLDRTGGLSHRKEVIGRVEDDKNGKQS